VPRDVALPALIPLIRGTVANLAAVGIPDALTGPIARGDLGTVKRHVHELQTMPGDLMRLYRELARKTVEIALRKGTIDLEGANGILESLQD
jgi:predicted short-subunit dehydrogenase-like oxidoreductase (DUF2520 family)